VSNTATIPLRKHMTVFSFTVALSIIPTGAVARPGRVPLHFTGQVQCAPYGSRPNDCSGYSSAPSFPLIEERLPFRRLHSHDGRLGGAFGEPDAAFHFVKMLVEGSAASVRRRDFWCGVFFWRFWCAHPSFF